MNVSPGINMKFKYMFKNSRPNRSQLNGMSPSEFKTLLRRKGFKVPRDFYCNSTAYRDNRAFRFRWWNATEFQLDISCKLNDFDRWANSTEYIVSFKEWMILEQYSKTSN